MYGINEYLQACHYRREFLKEQLKWLQNERQNFAVDAERLAADADRIRQEMIGYLLPEVGDDHIVALERRLSYPGLTPIKREYDARFDAAEKRRAELEAMDEIEHYDYQIEQAHRDVEDVRPAYDKTRKQIRSWENSKWFAKLHRRGYFKRDYSAGFFRRFFDWRDVSFLMAELGRTSDLDFQVPVKLREHYRNLREEADTVIAAFDKRATERDRIAALKKEHQELVSAPERLLSDLFRDLGKASVQHLDACPEDLRLELARGDENLNAFFRKQVGVGKQIQYLRELSVTRVDARIQQVDQELIKINNKIQKLEMQRRRGKRKRYSQDDIHRMRNVKAEKWDRNRAKTIKIRGKIADFRKYDRGSFATNYLWWDLMTGGSAADDIFEVREFRQRYPDWNHRSYVDPTVGAVGLSIDPTNVWDEAAEDLASSMMENTDDGFSDLS